jgi:hypothetical protein
MMVFAVDRFERARLQIEPSPRSSDTDTTAPPATPLGGGGVDTFEPFGDLPWFGGESLYLFGPKETSGPRSSESSPPCLGERVNRIAKEMRGASSANGPGGGNLACAYMVRKVLEKAGVRLPKINSVPALVDYLTQNGLAKEVPPTEARPGDITYIRNHHMGVVVGSPNGGLDSLSNSSSGKKFSWLASGLNFGGYYGQEAKILRLIG